MINIKVDGGTTKSGKSLCLTCKNATRVIGQQNQQIVHCRALDRDVRFDVAECNIFQDVSHPDLYTMEEIAWRLVTKQAGRQIGFLKPADFRKFEKERRLEDGEPQNLPTE